MCGMRDAPVCAQIQTKAAKRNFTACLLHSLVVLIISTAPRNRDAHVTADGLDLCNKHRIAEVHSSIIGSIPLTCHLQLLGSPGAEL